MKNLFIALEGIDGSGKSTQAKLLAQKLTEAGHNVYSTFEPTDGMIGSVLRKILTGKIKADHRTIAGLFLADRLDHLLNEETGLVKKMEEGYTVITDRYYFSSYAYHGTHMDMDWVIAANKMCADILKPSVTLFIDVTPTTAMHRINTNRASTELFENRESLEAIREKYFEAFTKLKHDESIFITNGDRTQDIVSDELWTKVSSLL